MNGKDLGELGIVRNALHLATENENKRKEIMEFFKIKYLFLLHKVESINKSSLLYVMY